MSDEQFDNLAEALDAAAESNTFTNIATALTMAELVANATVGGPFTVFAPTDEAFSRLPASTLAELLNPEKKEQLTIFLGDHVLPNVLLSGELVSGPVTTVTGKELYIETQNGTVTVNGATVTQADIVTGNGVIHVVDQVLFS